MSPFCAHFGCTYDILLNIKAWLSFLPSSSNIKPAIKKSIIIYYSYLNNTLNGFFYCKKGTIDLLYSLVWLMCFYRFNKWPQWGKIKNDINSVKSA